MYKIVNRRKYLLTACADAVLRAVCWPRRLGRPPPPVPESIASILVIRTAYVGDVVLTLPLLKPLRDRFPAAKISFLTSSGAAPLLRNHPQVDEILTYDPFWFYPHSPKRAYLQWRRAMRPRRFDLVIEARADLREILMLVRPLRARCKVSYAVGGGGCLPSVWSTIYCSGQGSATATSEPSSVKTIITPRAGTETLPSLKSRA